jgi:hypothetical protein
MLAIELRLFEPSFADLELPPNIAQSPLLRLIVEEAAEEAGEAELIDAALLGWLVFARVDMARVP